MMSEINQELLRQLAERLSLSPEQVETAASRGDVDGLLQNTDCDGDRVRGILSDPARQQQLLQTPQAQAILKMLGQQ